MISRRATSIALGVAGLGITVYLSVVDLSTGQVPLVCSTGGLVNCDLVTSSPQSRVGPIPIAVLGALWFAVMLASLGFEDRGGLLGSATTQLLWTGAGLLTVFYLVYAELFLIGAICLWCTALHAIIVALFLLALGRFTGAAPSE